MLPVLLDLKFIKIYTFGVFLVLAFFWGSFLLWKLIRLTSFKEEDIFDGLFLSLGSGLFFSRLFYVILNFKDFGLDILKFILINGYPGLSLYGAIFGGVLVFWLFLYFKKIKLAEVVDYFIPALFLALAFGKLGSFFSGAEAGTKTKFFLAVKYANFDGLRHLTPFYESLFFFLAVYFSYKLLFEIRKEKLFHGFLFYFFFWLTGLTYFLFDKIKANHLYFLGGSFNKMVSTILFLTFSFYFLYYFRNHITKVLKFYGRDTIKKLRERIKKD